MRIFKNKSVYQQQGQQSKNTASYIHHQRCLKTAAVMFSENILKEKIIGKIKYNQEYDEIINNNLKISKENIKNLIKEFQVLNI